MAHYIPSTELNIPTVTATAMQSASRPGGPITIESTGTKKDNFTDFSSNEVALITFDSDGHILSLNSKAKEFFHPAIPSKIQDVMFAPNYFLEMTKSSLIVQKKKTQYWDLDLRRANRSPLLSRFDISLGSDSTIFEAKIQTSGSPSVNDPFYSLHDVCIISYSRNQKILGAEGTERILGYLESELVDTQAKDLMSIEDCELLRTKQDKENQTSSPLPVRLKSKKGDQVPMQLHNLSTEGKTSRCLLRRPTAMQIPSHMASPVNMHKKQALSPTVGRPFISRTQSPIICNDPNSLTPKTVKVEATPEIIPVQILSGELPIFRILLVEDNLINQITIKRILLQLKQIVVQVCPDGKEGLDYLKKTSSLPDLIITDRNMPNMGGLELLQEVRQDLKLKHLPAIFWSDDLKDIDTETVERLKICQFMDKPATKGDVKKKLIAFSQKQSHSSPSKRSFEE